MKKSITIHDLDAETAKLIEERAKTDGRSLNKTIQSLLEQSLGIRRPKEPPHLAEFSEFLGKWKPSDRSNFEKVTRDLRKVDDEDWQR